MQQQILKRPILFHAVGLALILTVLGGASAIAIQQLLRRGANQPQIHMSDLYGAKISSGTGLELALPAAHLDLEQALEPFIIFYDDETRPERATGFLNGETPKPPPGVFNYLRTHETDTLTWQPKTGVRIAAVIRRIAGPHPGFLLVGRSLRVVEEQESFLRMMVIFGWLAVMVIIALGATLLLRAERLRLSSERFA